MWGHIEFNTHDSSHLVVTVYADDKQLFKNIFFKIKKIRRMFCI